MFQADPLPAYMHFRMHFVQVYQIVQERPQRGQLCKPPFSRENKIFVLLFKRSGLA